jgi:hypothetical protein
MQQTDENRCSTSDNSSLRRERSRLSKRVARVRWTSSHGM